MAAEGWEEVAGAIETWIAGVPERPPAGAKTSA